MSRNRLLLSRSPAVRGDEFDIVWGRFPARENSNLVEADLYGQGRSLAAALHAVLPEATRQGVLTALIDLRSTSSTFPRPKPTFLSEVEQLALAADVEEPER